MALLPGGMCWWCLLRPAVCVHEIEPKSKRPKDWDTPANRIPLCNICHRLVHDEWGTARSEWRLQKARQRALDMLHLTEIDLSKMLTQQHESSDP